MKSLVGLVVAFALIACGASDQDSESESLVETPGNPLKLNIGFNGDANQFGYYDDFMNASTIHPGPRLCHWYLPWNMLSTTSHTTDSKNAFDHFTNTWLPAAAGKCQEVLISFKGDPGVSDAKTQTEYKVAVETFVELVSSLSQYGLKFSFTAWNEPNNGSPEGDGFNTYEIGADEAAEYYLQLESICRKYGCKVAAGDFATNGEMWKDLSWNCANDLVPRNELCKSLSAYAKYDKNSPSYMDDYKNYIVNHAASHGLGTNFRPEYFAYHGWHDVNDFINDDNKCESYEDCATRRLLIALGNAWKNVEIWDTEVGVSQGPNIGDHDQACGAAFLVRLNELSSRITRTYYTRLYNSGTSTGGQLVNQDHSLRPAAKTLALRKETCN